MGGDISSVLEDRVIVPLVTPLKQGKFVSYGTVKRICRRIDNGRDISVLVAGKTGNLEAITDHQRASMLGVVKEHFNGHILYCIGDPKTGADPDGTHAGLARVMSHLDVAANTGGIDAVVVPTLFYPNGEVDSAVPSMRNYFLGILKRATQAQIPMVFYNNPAMTGAEIPLELVNEFSKHPFVAGIKDSSGSWDYFTGLLDIALDRAKEGLYFKVFQGDEKKIAESIALGADGIVPSIGNLYPGLVKAAVWNPDLQFVVNEIGAGIYSNYAKIVEGILYGLSVMGIYKEEDGLAASPSLAPEERSTIRRRIMSERHKSSRGKRAV